MKQIVIRPPFSDGEDWRAPVALGALLLLLVIGLASLFRRR